MSYPTVPILSSYSLTSQDQKEDCEHYNSFIFPQDNTSIPEHFIWPKSDVVPAHDEFKGPVVDLEGFMHGDILSTASAVKIIREACLNQGLFQVINHGIDSSLISSAYDHMDAFFNLSVAKKSRAKKTPGCLWGYSGAHFDRFSSKLPWKEMLSFSFNDNNDSDQVEEFFISKVGSEFKHTGRLYKKYCEAMKFLSLRIMELLAMSLEVDQHYYREFFEDSCSIMRCNYYPPCQQPSLVLGTGPHCDSTALTILHQDQVGGLEISLNGKWYSVPPRQDAFVINIGDTFTALSNGTYKSCLHRAVVHRHIKRRSLAFFLCPRKDKVVKPPKDLVCSSSSSELLRKYPDFTWSDLLQFTQKHYRADGDTLQNFTKWLASPSAP